MVPAIIEPAPVDVVYRDNLFAGSPRRHSAAPGRTIAELMGELPIRPRLLPYITVSAGGQPVPRHLWPNVRPRPGTELVAWPTPQGGQGGGAKAARTAGTLAILAAASAVAGPVAGAAGGGFLGGLAGGAAAAATGLGASLAMNRLAP